MSLKRKVVPKNLVGGSGQPQEESEKKRKYERKEDPLVNDMVNAWYNTSVSFTKCESLALDQTDFKRFVGSYRKAKEGILIARDIANCLRKGQWKDSFLSHILQMELRLEEMMEKAYDNESDE